MKLPIIKRIRKEDFDPEYDGLLTGLLYAINTFFETVTNGLNRNLTFTDNFAGQVKEITITAPITSTNKIEFKKEFTGQCKGIMIVEVVPETAGELLTASPFAQFTTTEAGISIYNITGLANGNKYRIKFVCLAGP